LFNFFKKAERFFSDEERKQIVQSIQLAEQQTSGEIRLFVESRCRFVDAVDRAQELFFNLKMYETQDRNAVLVYLAIKDKQIAIFADEGIHKKLGNEFWENEINIILKSFKNKQFVDGINGMIGDIGEALKKEFPYNRKNDINELSDDIIFGK
jgi:uncharacterized membrane protein